MKAEDVFEQFALGLAAVGCVVLVCGFVTLALSAPLASVLIVAGIPAVWALGWFISGWI